MLFPLFNCMSPTKETYMLEVVLFGDVTASYRCEICQWKVWHPFCSVTVQSGLRRLPFYFTGYCYPFGWLTQNASGTYLNGNCSIFVTQTILWKLVFCHSPEQCEVKKMACVSHFCYRILVFFFSLSYQHFSQRN